MITIVIEEKAWVEYNKKSYNPLYYATHSCDLCNATIVHRLFSLRIGEKEVFPLLCLRCAINTAWRIYHFHDPTQIILVEPFAVDISRGEDEPA